MSLQQMETLIGGPCDGLGVAKQDGGHIYAGRIGDGRVNLYVRGRDGRLHYFQTWETRRCLAPSKSAFLLLTSSANTISVDIR